MRCPTLPDWVGGRCTARMQLCAFAASCRDSRGSPTNAAHAASEAMPRPPAARLPWSRIAPPPRRRDGATARRLGACRPAADGG